jgi:GNAT superfamily N-acetyltransferase
MLGPMSKDASLQIRGLDKSDYDYVVSVLDRWWGGPSGQRASPVFFYELGSDALVVEEHGKVVGFLLGFVVRVSSEPTGYIHLVGIDPEHRRRGVGHLLYERFVDRCRGAGVKRLKAIAAVGNEGSVRFHEAMGFSATEVADYAGPGRARMVFERTL